MQKKAVVLFKKQKPEQKRRLISLLVSNCTYKDEKLDIELKTPFYKIMKTANARNWCARQDSNLPSIRRCAPTQDDRERIRNPLRDVKV